MENKEPKEIWINLDGMTSYSLSKTEGNTKLNPINGEWLNYDFKYLSETHVKELLCDKDKEINDLLKIVSERNAEIADINRYLDDNGYPSQDRYGNTYSIIERIENA